MIVSKPTRRKTARQPAAMGGRAEGQSGLNRTSEPNPSQNLVRRGGELETEITTNARARPSQQGEELASNLESEINMAGNMGSRFRALANLDLNMGLESEDDPAGNQEDSMPALEEPNLEGDNFGGASPALITQPSLGNDNEENIIPLGNNSQQIPLVSRTRGDAHMPRQSPRQAHITPSPLHATQLISPTTKPHDATLGPEAQPGKTYSSQGKSLTSPTSSYVQGPPRTGPPRSQGLITSISRRNNNTGDPPPPLFQPGQEVQEREPRLHGTIDRPGDICDREGVSCSSRDGTRRGPGN